MATYNKRGYRTPKEKVDDSYLEENINVDEKDSATAGVFNSLDETASRTEAWVEKNQKIIFIIVGVIAAITVAYVLYQKFIVEPREDEAANAMFTAQQNFQQAADGVKSDSLYTLSLKGSEGKFGFVDIADKFSGTDAGNLANYYAGIAYLNTGKYAEAVSSLDKFSADDMVLGTLAIGAKGDAYSQQNKMKEALDQYEKAAANNKNEFTSPMFLLKAAKTAIALGNKETAIKHLNDIKDNYSTSPEAQNVDALLGLAQ